jgi:hypothetical protein
LAIDSILEILAQATLSIYDIAVSGWAANGTEVTARTLFPGAEPDSAIAIDFVHPVAEFLMGWGDPNFVGNSLLAFDTPMHSLRRM